MRASDLLGDEFPHGTVDGFYRGCKGSHCPGAIACRDVYRRYAGDAEFRSLIDHGVTAEQIVDQELNTAAVQEQERRAAELERRRAAEEARAAEKERRRQVAIAERRAQREAAAEEREVAAQDREVARQARAAAAKAEALREVAERSAEMAAWSARFEELLARVERAAEVLRLARKELAEHKEQRPSTRHPYLARRRSGSLTEEQYAELRRLNELGVNDSEIARRLGSNAKTIGNSRRRLGLPTRWSGGPLPVEEVRS